MQLNEYQEKALGTAFFKDKAAGPLGGLTYTVLALCGEGGELANKLKKHLRAGTVPDKEGFAVLMDELGDVLWYTAATAKELGYSLEEVALFNIEKLRLRHEQKVKAG